MATRLPPHGNSGGETSSLVQTELTLNEKEILEKRRRDVQNYEPVKWRSKEMDPVSGEYSEIAMVNRTSILLTFCFHFAFQYTLRLLERKSRLFLLDE